MKAIDSLLKILVQQGGTELRLAADRRPQMFMGEDELPLTIPPMSTQQIHALLDDLWTTHQAELNQRRQVVLSYQSPELGNFAVNLVQPDESGLEVCFRRDRVEARADDKKAGADRLEDVTVSASTSSGEEGGELPPAVVALLVHAATQGASDIHLSPQRGPIVRRNGELEALEGEAGFDVTALLDGQEQLEQLRAGRSVDRALDIAAVGRVRVNVYASEEGLCAAIRILKREVPKLSDLNLPSLLEPLVDIPHGLIIACGPTGSGKSTTLAALVQLALRTRPQVLVTLEDPIEYIIRPMRASGLVRQREVGTHVRDFATGLRDALREDPDLLLVGEMRDPETISLALTAAETGHLVFASLHSRTATSAVERIVDIYAPERQRQIRVQLADSLRAVISQRLIPSADGTGQVAAVELLRVTHGVANLIREGRTAQIINALQGGASEGMLVLERNLADLVRANRIRRETAQAVANDASALNEYLRTG